MKALKITGIVVLAVIVIAVVSIAVMSPQSHIERSIVINAQPAAIYEELVDFKAFNTWSPWAAIDPDTRYTFEGPQFGVGAKMNWASDNSNVGQGSQWIIEAEENKRVKTGMAFAGFEGSFVAEFILEPVDGGTKVTWTYDGDVRNTGPMNAAMGKLMGSFTDSMLGPQYEQGLAALKRRSESKSAPQTDPEQEPDPIQQ